MGRWEIRVTIPTLELPRSVFCPFIPRVEDVHLERPTIKGNGGAMSDFDLDEQDGAGESFFRS
jgi:hypothetical protein